MISYASGVESIPVLIRDPARQVDLNVPFGHNGPKATTFYTHVSTRNLQAIGNPHDDFFR